MVAILSLFSVICLIWLGLAVIGNCGQIGKWCKGKSERLFARLTKFLLRLPIAAVKSGWRKNRLVTTLVLLLLAAWVVGSLFSFAVTS